MIPMHVGVILDGNRRFAKELMKKPWEGHKLGVIKAREVLEWACELGVKYFTAYVLSLENLSTRPRKELKLILKYLESEADEMIQDAGHAVHRFRINVRFIGRLNILPETLQKKLSAVEGATKNYKNHFLNIAVAYGGQQEIVDATKKIVKKCLDGVLNPASLDEKIMKENLYTNGQPFPDLIIRSGGEKRISNFMTFQSAYSELVFLDKKWPALTKADFLSAIKEFESRKRRFGR
ncbi:MAG: di-trans,poly-cis-decaprenylcistransferase [Candidatus Aenigmarchaeota archaeon]|nr:di-trans,poly-cis-decaprenylcistransferase [Candidatus Aenigmarchaeota archaeon]